MTEPNGLSPARILNLRRRRFAFALAALLAVVFLFMIGKLIVGVVCGMLLWTMTDWLYKRMLKRVRGRRSAAAGITLLLVVLVIIVPLSALGFLMVADAMNLAQAVSAWYEPLKPRIAEKLDLLGRGQSLYVFGYELTGESIVNRLEALSGQAGKFLLGLLQHTAGGLAGTALFLGVMLYSLFFFYLDGETFVAWLKKLTPLAPEQSDRLVGEFFATSRAAVKVLVVIGLVQGALGALAFWICGIPAPFFWFMLMAIASVIPAVGVQIITLPAGILLIIAGKPWFGIGLLIWSWLVIANADNLLRPHLMQREVKLHELLVFLGALGGIATFGLFGVILGPVIAALLKTSTEIYAAVASETTSSA